MAKKAVKEVIEPQALIEEQDELMKVFVIYKAKDEGYAQAFGLKEYVISRNQFEKHATLNNQTNPDIFAIFMNQVTRYFRDFFGI
jgi:hypothetical protein